jgi:UDP-glucose 4-epimerase
LEYARKSETPVFFSSSSSVYGKNTKLPKIETDWLSPISPYAASKLSAEALCQAYAESFGLKISVLRLFNVYGPAQNPENVYAAVIPKWIRSAMKGDPIEVYGDGEQKRDFTFVDDVTSVMEDIMNKIDISIPPTNLAYGQSVSLNHILDIFKEYYGDIEVKYSAYRKGDIRDSESDTTKMMELKVGPSSPTAIKDGLLKTFKWFAKRQ